MPPPTVALGCRLCGRLPIAGGALSKWTTSSDFRRMVPLCGTSSAPHRRRHASLGITSIYLQGIDSSEIVSTVHGGRRRRSLRALASRSGAR